MSDKWYCVLPFRHVFIDSIGISPCCNISRRSISLEDWSSDPMLKSIQSDLLSGTIPAQCYSCRKQEEISGESLRTSSNADYNHQVITDTNINFIDYRSSNICNFKCRSCEPQFSNGISHEVKSNPMLSEFYAARPSKTVSITDKNEEWIIENLSKIDRLMITGGEPTIMPSARNIIDEVLRNHADRIHLMITTNGSFTDQYWFDLTTRVKNLHWTISIDGIGEDSNIIRYGSDWNIVSKNAIWLATNATSLNVNTVISNLNVLRLGTILQYVSEIQKLGTGHHRHQFHVIKKPSHMAADNWPDEWKPRVLSYLESCLTADLDVSQFNTVIGLIDRISSTTFSQHLWDKGYRHNTILDKIRNQDHTSLFQLTDKL
jgi:sulfatase maturation enzyme AslB (radical SAM superfamily)